MSRTGDVSSAPCEALDVIYENAEMLVVNKAADIPMDGDMATYSRTVESMVYDHMKARGIFDEAHERLQREKKRRKQLKFVHQLDYGTSGVLCLALTKDMAARLAHCFEMRATRKFYVALLHGHIPSDTAPLEDVASHDLPGATSASDTRATCSPFAGWVKACNQVWEGVGCVQVVGSPYLYARASGEAENSADAESVSGFCHLLQEFHGKTFEGATLRNGNDEEETESGTVVHRYPSSRRFEPSLMTSTPGKSARPPAGSVGSFIYRTLCENLSSCAGVFLNLPVGYDVTDPAHFRMAVTAEQSRCATTSVLVMKRTFLSASKTAESETPPCDTVGHHRSMAARHPVTLVLLAPHTGRRHQLRVHCRAIGFPIVGDALYSTELPWCPASLAGASPSTWMAARVERMYLHAWRLLLPGSVQGSLDEADRVALKKKRRRETLGLSERADVSVSTSRGEWTEFVAAVDFPGLDLSESESERGL
ncbi:hypothetical protein JKF63_02939 [Porcisia hertigi]|uniref:Pseudouridine synthase RsuA/RluA-like domain-containing protein n=1 Tax=Porcisia hertigi TaxID=2761500 RepID=A0A836LFW2_9TRYP|nr:hypothetical protein JKF63_02939 [Porcisia hertigi]